MSRISILTLFPEQIIQGLAHSIVGKAIENGILELDFRNIRDFAINKHGQVDDALYGGGTGMLMMLEPIIKVGSVSILKTQINIWLNYQLKWI